MVVCVLSYALRMFAITAFYHRLLFLIATFKTSRPVQFLFAVIGASGYPARTLVVGCPSSPSITRWPTAPRTRIRRPPRLFVESHGLVSQPASTSVPITHRFPTWCAYPGASPSRPLRPAGAGGLRCRPCSGWVQRWSDWHRGWGPAVGRCSSGVYFISTVVLIHVTLTINSLAHVWGTRRYATRDDSRNNIFLAPADPRRGLAQQSSSFSGLRSPGLFLVGNRYQLLHTQSHEFGRVGEPV